MTAERLQKIMAGCGVASRRASEEMIAAGRVRVNGVVVRELGTKADVERDEILVDGKRIEAAEKRVYILLNKPKGYVTTLSDPEGRPVVMDLLKNGAASPALAGVGSSQMPRVYPVGRLDYASEGLLLMTNDGELAAKLTRAGSHVEKTYLVKVSGRVEEEKMARLRTGVVIELEDGRKVKTAPAEIKLVRGDAVKSGEGRAGLRRGMPSAQVASGEGRAGLRRGMPSAQVASGEGCAGLRRGMPSAQVASGERRVASGERKEKERELAQSSQRAKHRGHGEEGKHLSRGWRVSSERENPWYEVTLIEGRNRQIRRMFEKVGHHVEKIRRVRMGPLKLDVGLGKWRELRTSEIAELKRAADGGKGG
jgi:pseudouridine synthase